MAFDAGHRGAVAGAVLVNRPWFDAYVGLPFGEGQGEVTCWALVCRIYRDQLGISLPSYGEISAADLMRVARAMRAGADDGWITIGTPRALDVVLMRGAQGGSSVVHVGVMVDGVRMIHVERAAAAAVVPINHWTVAGRITGFRRRA
jgi:cell wall-associated NlpC family hydrolase